MGAFDRLTLPQIMPLFMLGMRRVDRELPETGLEAQARGNRRRRTFVGLLRADSDLRESAAVDAWVRFHAAEELAVAAGTLTLQAAEDETGKIQRFLQWIIDHREEIFAFIQMIIGLFSDVPVGAVGSELLAAHNKMGACGNRGPPLTAQSLWGRAVDLDTLLGIATAVEEVRGAVEKLGDRLKVGIDSVKSAA
jgi:hypothetical protein